MKNDKLKGCVLITLGSAGCYGMLGTYVKLAYQAGFNPTAEVTIARFSLYFRVVLCLTLLRRPQATLLAAGHSKASCGLTLAGPSLGLTSIFCYLSVKYIAVSVAIVLLTQSVWMGVVVKRSFKKNCRAPGKILSVLIVMIGSILATNVLTRSLLFNWKDCAVRDPGGALFTTATMFSTNHLGVRFPPLKRSLFMVLGGLVVILIVFHRAINPAFAGPHIF